MTNPTPTDPFPAPTGPFPGPTQEIEAVLTYGAMRHLAEIAAAAAEQSTDNFDSVWVARWEILTRELHLAAERFYQGVLAI